MEAMGYHGHRDALWGLLQSSRMGWDSDEGSGCSGSSHRIWQTPGDAESSCFLRPTHGLPVSLKASNTFTWKLAQCISPRDMCVTPRKWLVDSRHVTIAQDFGVMSENGSPCHVQCTTWVAVQEGSDVEDYQSAIIIYRSVYGSDFWKEHMSRSEFLLWALACSITSS